MRKKIKTVSQIYFVFLFPFIFEMKIKKNNKIPKEINFFTITLAT